MPPLDRAVANSAQHVHPGVVFHSGEGPTLEIRVFLESDVKEKQQQICFANIPVHWKNRSQDAAASTEMRKGSSLGCNSKAARWIVGILESRLSGSTGSESWKQLAW